jgi:hypothetical protein
MDVYYLESDSDSSSSGSDSSSSGSDSESDSESGSDSESRYSSHDNSDNDSSNNISDDDDDNNSDDDNDSNDDDSDNDDNNSDDDNKIYNELVQEAHAIQNRGGRRSGTTIMEARRFRSFFGTSVEVVMNLWGLLANHNLLPWKGKIKHLLWTLFFMKVYPTEPPSCSALGGSHGAIDPKTMRKWVWRFIQQIAKLGPVVVSVITITLLLFLSLFHICLILLPSCCLLD